MLGGRHLAQVDTVAGLVLRPRPGATEVRLQARVGVPNVRVVEQRAAGQVDDAVAAESRGADGDVLAPDARDGLTALVHEKLVHLEHRRAGLQGQRLLEVEGKADGADRAANAHLVGGIVDDPAVPRRHAGLGVQAKVGAPVGGRKAAGGEYRLPAALVEVHPQAQRRPGRGDELRWVAHPPGRAPEKVDVGRLVDQLEDVGALVGKHYDAQQLVLHHHGLQPAVGPRVGDAAPVVAFVLIVHRRPSPRLRQCSAPAPPAQAPTAM